MALVSPDDCSLDSDIIQCLRAANQVTILQLPACQKSCKQRSSCVLAGKTTLLKALAGKHMVSQGTVLVYGHSPFHHTELTTSGELAYLGGNWVRDIAFAGYSIPLQVCLHLLATFATLLCSTGRSFAAACKQSLVFWDKCLKTLRILRAMPALNVKRLAITVSKAAVCSNNLSSPVHKLQGNEPAYAG